MAARTKKTTAEETAVAETENVTVEVAETPKRRGGRKPSPLTALIRDHEKAQARVIRAEAKWAKVSGVEQELKEAREAAETAAAALREALGTV